jgi:SAM-dependent methyltransferase
MGYVETQNSRYFINYPVLMKYLLRYDFGRWKLIKYLKNPSGVNERIVELPFAIQSLSHIPPGKRVLDLGCTESVLPLEVVGLGYQVTGLDMRAYPYSHPQFHFIQGNILHLPFRDAVYDAVLCISTLEHIGVEVYANRGTQANADQWAMREIRRVLSPGGMLVLTVPYGVAHITAHQRIYGRSQLATLLQGFHIHEIRYFVSRRTPHNLLNYWQRIEVDEADSIKTEADVQGVCLVRAFKE